MTGNDPLSKFDYKGLREALEASVKRRMMCDVPYGVLLSGGLDSSLVSSIVSRYAKQMVCNICMMNDCYCQMFDHTKLSAPT